MGIRVTPNDYGLRNGYAKRCLTEGKIYSVISTKEPDYSQGAKPGILYEIINNENESQFWHSQFMYTMEELAKETCQRNKQPRYI